MTWTPKHRRRRHAAAVVLFAVGLVAAWRLLPPQPGDTFDPGPPSWSEGRHTIASADVTLVALPGRPAVHVWDLARRRPVTTLTPPWSGSTPAQNCQTWPRTFSHDATMLVTMYHDAGQYHLAVWDLATGQRRLVITSGRYLIAVRFSPDDRTLYVQSIEAVPVGNFMMVISVWDLTTSQRRVLYLNARELSEVVLSPDGRTLAWGTMGLRGKPGRIVLWDIAAGNERAAMPVPGWPRNLAFSPDGSTLVSENDRTVRVWDVATATERYAFTAFSDWNEAHHLWLAPRGDVLAVRLLSTLPYRPWARSLPHWMKMWFYWDYVALYDVNTGARLATLPRGEFVTFADAGRTALTYDGRLHWWDVPPAKPYALIILAAAACGLIPLMLPWSGRGLRRFLG